MSKYLSILVLLLLIVSVTCVEDEQFIDDDNPDTTLADTVMVLTINEPSGLAFSVLKDALYTVSDNNGKIYKISFKGKIIDELLFVGNDLEGIAIDQLNGDIFVVEEGFQRVKQLNSAGTVINTISSIHIDTGNSGSGFEGIAKNGDTLYIVFEKDPGVLIKYNTVSNTWNQRSLSFAVDYSGIDYDTSDNTLWIVSDESKTVNHCTLNGTLIKSQKIEVEQAEGIAVDREKNIVWIVSDKGNKLHRISLKI